MLYNRYNGLYKANKENVSEYLSSLVEGLWVSQEQTNS